MQVSGFPGVKISTKLEHYRYACTPKEALSKRYANLPIDGYFSNNHNILEMQRREDYYREVREAMEKSGIEICYQKGESGAAQDEVLFEGTNAMELADMQMWYKLAVKQIAEKYGYTISFMA